MENDLISSSALLLELRSKSMLSAFPQYRTWADMPSFERNAVCTYANTVKGIINKAPAVDAEPVRHGRWYDTDRISAHKNPIYQCSVCKYEVEDYYIKYHKF